MSGLRTLLKPKENVTIYAISIDDHEKTRELKGKIESDGKGVVKFALLSDPDHRVIESYGVRAHEYDGKAYGDIKLEGIPKASVFVIDLEGRVAWAKIEENYKTRPTNADIRAALDSINQKARPARGRRKGRAPGKVIRRGGVSQSLKGRAAVGL